MWDIFLIGRKPIPKLSINLTSYSLQPSITSYSMILSITNITGRKPEMGNTKPFRLEPGFNYTMPEFMVLISYTLVSACQLPWLSHTSLSHSFRISSSLWWVILCLFIDITHDTNPYKNIINQVTRIKI